MRDTGREAADAVKKVAHAMMTFSKEKLNKDDHKERLRHFDEKIERRCQERKEVCNTFHQSCEKLYLETFFRIGKENAKKRREKKRIIDTMKDYTAITERLTTLINNPPSFLRYLGFSQASISWDGLSHQIVNYLNLKIP